MPEDGDQNELIRLREEVAKLRRQLYWGGMIFTGLLICSIVLPTWLFFLIVVATLFFLYPGLRKGAGRILEKGARRLRGGP